MESLQFFGIKAEGLIGMLFIMGFVIYKFIDNSFPFGEIVIGIAVFLCIIDIFIVLDDKSRKSKRGW